MSMVSGDPVDAINEFFDERLRMADRVGLRHRCILDPGTGFAPPAWPWEERYLYQKEVYSRLAELRRFDLPLYVALPWRRTEQHDELLELVVRQQPEYARVHHPDRVRAVEAAVL
jgi:dihydropteroate synthase